MKNKDKIQKFLDSINDKNFKSVEVELDANKVNKKVIDLLEHEK